VVDYNLINELSVEEDQADSLVAEALDQMPQAENLESLFGEQAADFKPGTILEGRVIGFAGDSVVIDVDRKSVV